MKPIREAFFGLIDITYYCGRECVYCTRCDRHLGNKRYHMALDYFENALRCYQGFAGQIGIIGGEPLLYPQLNEACEIIRRYFSKNKMMIFTSIDPQKSKYRDAIFQTFGDIPYHPHTEEQESAFAHQPLTIAIKDVIKNEKLRLALIEDCWVQRKWCPTVTDDGAYFCEVGASIAKLLGVKGWPVEPHWWEREPRDFGEQREMCQYCGMCIPMACQKMKDKKQKISPSFLKLLQDRNLPTGEYEIFDRQILRTEMKKAQPNWKPGIYKKEQLSECFIFSSLNFDNFED
jgi:hypothetical protein